MRVPNVNYNRPQAGYNSGPMPKDTRITFRVNSELKKQIEAIAAEEGRSVAQICEAFLRRGSSEYLQNRGKSLRQYFRSERQHRSAE